MLFFFLLNMPCLALVAESHVFSGYLQSDPDENSTPLVVTGKYNLIPLSTGCDKGQLVKHGRRLKRAGTSRYGPRPLIILAVPVDPP